MERNDTFDVEMRIIEVESGAAGKEDYRPVTLRTSRGIVECRYYPAPGARRGAIWVGGVGGGWDSPASGLYPRLCQEMVGETIASLRVKYRQPTNLEESVLDVLAGLFYLESEGIEVASLTGHSFGGAVVIQAAANSESVRTVVTLSTQSYGAGPAARLAPRCSLLAIHGRDDHVLPPTCSEYVYNIAGDPRRLRLYPGTDHGLDEAASEVYEEVRRWILEQLPSNAEA